MSKVLLVGASSRLGLTLARKLNAHGYETIGISRSDVLNGSCYSRIIKCDLANSDSVHSAVDSLHYAIDHVVLLAAIDIYNCDRCVEVKSFLDSVLINALSQAAIVAHCAQLNPNVTITAISSDVVHTDTRSSFSYAHSKILLEASLTYITEKMELGAKSLKIQRLPYLGYQMKNVTVNSCECCIDINEPKDAISIEEATSRIISESFLEMLTDEP